MATSFNAEFIERRMTEHRRWQHEAEHCLVEEMIEEIQALPKRQPRTGRLFDLLPPHVQATIAADLEPKSKRRGIYIPRRCENSTPLKGSLASTATAYRNPEIAESENREKVF
jgi:hypothetical protein